MTDRNMVGVYRPRPDDLFEQAMSKGWVRITPEGNAYRASFEWNGMRFAGIGPTMDMALEGLRGHVRLSKGGAIRS